jgi:hypothetical protein
MSRRPTLVSSHRPGLDYQATYYRVFQAVKTRRALLHGKLEEGEFTCAVGAYFRESRVPIDARAIEEIAAYNDSFPGLCPAQRWRKVLAWLRVRALEVR